MSHLIFAVALGSLFLDGVFRQKVLSQGFSARCMPFITLITTIIIIMVIKCSLTAQEFVSYMQ